MTVPRSVPFVVLPMAAAAAALWFLTRVPREALPQGGGADDLLGVLLGDARRDISGAMLREADLYFHGGIDMERHEHGCPARPSHAAHRDSAHEHEEPAARPRLWSWIGERIRAPQVERHLEGDKALEMMPWFALAVRSDPHNTEAWGAAWYTAAYVKKDAKLALRIAEEGRRANPSCIDLAVCLARSCRLAGTEDPARAEREFRAACALGEAALRAGRTLPDAEISAFRAARAFLDLGKGGGNREKIF